MSDIDEYIRRRNHALEAMDIQWFIDVLKLNGNDNPDPFTVLVSMHKARYNIPSINAAYRHESGRWLRERGFTDLHGMPLLPQGFLPE